ncbi:peptidase [Aureococcus anophagefferens]|nr:peptidase [Aureococcus anophagefferens]
MGLPSGRAGTAIADLLGADSLCNLTLPYPGRLVRRRPARRVPDAPPSPQAAWRLMSGHGRCIQGVNGASPGARRAAPPRARAIRSGASTHRGTLCYSFDFKLAVGTPVHAVRGGVVAAVVQHFSGGGAKAHLAPRANFVAVRHDDGSYARYYHLRTDGSLFKVGDSVEAGQHIAFSGNTGYTGGPHLHLDVVNLLPEETSRLRVAVALADRDPACSFAQKVDQLAKRGAVAAIVANNRSGPEVFAMGGCERPSAIPCVLVSKEHGAWLKQALADHGGAVFVSLAAHPAVADVETLDAQLRELRKSATPRLARAETPLSFKYGPQLRYVTRTLPVEFANRAGAPFVPAQGVLYPRPTPAEGAPARDPEQQKQLEDDIAALKGSMDCDLSKLPRPKMEVPDYPLQPAGSLTEATVMRKAPTAAPKP